jgi:DNA processing protein
MVNLSKNYLILKNIKNIGDNTIIKIVESIQSLEHVFELDSSELKEIGLNKNQIESILNKNYDKRFIEEELTLIEKHKINIITYESELYPELLKETPSAPAYFYHYGKFDTLKKPAIGIVGARNASRISKEFTKQLASDLAEVGFNVVSGFAYGIDISAHIGAIQKGETTAVLGNGFLTTYPQENRKYLKSIIENGCLLSEFSMKTPPDAHNFPQRNRIISGLSFGTVVIEAAQKSGSLITARYALEQNREVFAVPTHPNNLNNATNKLIKDGAILTENYLDIVEALSYLLKPTKIVDKVINHNNITLDSKSKKLIYQSLSISEKSIDELHSDTNLPIDDLMVELTEMEMENYIFLNFNGKYALRNLNG